MILGVLKEPRFKRVAIAPKFLPKFSDLGLDFLVEKGAGENANSPDAEYIEQNAKIASRKNILAKSDIIVSISPLDKGELATVKKGCTLVSLFEPYNKPEVIELLDQFPVNAFSMDMIPRITLAQSMDVLSSMASLAGYKSILEANQHYGSMFPMMMTAAGTIPPAKVLILGAGVAGLQAIATAKRLGAVVEAFDTRAAAKGEVLSLGAKFVEVPGAVDDTAAGGYAVEQSEEYLQKQRALVQERASKSNIIVTTAQVRGRKAPLLVPEETINKMKVGSVIVDLATSSGGNVAFSEDNKVVNKNGIKIIGNSHLADLLPEVASNLFSNNLLNYLKQWVVEGALNLDMENEIIKQSLISKA